MSFQLGDSSENISFSSSEELLNLSLEMILQARQNIKIFSRDLDAKIYDQQEIIRAFTDFAIASRFTKVQILVQNPEKIISNGHRLLETSRRLSSSINILITGSDFKNFNESFVLVDNSGIIHKPVADRYQGTANFHSPLKNKQYQEIFAEAWAGAQEDENFKRLNI